MRHGRQRHKLSRDTAHRKALLRTMSKQVIEHERIRTSQAKAKAVKPEVEKLITLAKKGGLSNRRLAHARLLDDAQLVKLFDVLAKRYQERAGGYCRVIKAGIRASDAAPMAVIELVDRDPGAKGLDSGPVMTEEELEAA